MKLRNTHTRKIQEFTKLADQERADVYFKAAYERIFKQQLDGCCQAISFADGRSLYQVFTLVDNKVRAYKKVYAELYPEFMLFEKKYTSNGYWFDSGKEGREQRIIALLLCYEMVLNGERF